MRNTVHWKIKNSIMNDTSQLKETIFQTKSNVKCFFSNRNKLLTASKQNFYSRQAQSKLCLQCLQAGKVLLDHIKIYQ